MTLFQWQADLVLIFVLAFLVLTGSRVGAVVLTVVDAMLVLIAGCQQPGQEQQRHGDSEGLRHLSLLPGSRPSPLSSQSDAASLPQKAIHSPCSTRVMRVRFRDWNPSQVSSAALCAPLMRFCDSRNSLERSAPPSLKAAARLARTVRRAAKSSARAVSTTTLSNCTASPARHWASRAISARIT